MDDSVLRLIGARVRRIRKVKGMTQEQLAEKANTSHSYIGDLERGERNVTLQSLSKVSEALEVDFFELFQYGKFGQIEEKSQNVWKIIELLVDRTEEEQQKALNILKELFD